MKSVDNKRPLKVFLCHAHADRDAVRALYMRLTNDGVDAWLDKEKLLGGQNWRLEIRNAVEEADVVVVCHSKEFNKEGFRQREVRWALDAAMEKPEGEIFIIPARLEECEVINSLSDWHWVDLFEEDGYEMLMRALRRRADNIGATLQIKKSWLPNISPSNQAQKTKIKPQTIAQIESNEPDKVVRKPTQKLTVRRLFGKTAFAFWGIFVFVAIFLSLKPFFQRDEPMGEVNQSPVALTSTYTETVKPSSTTAPKLTSTPSVTQTPTSLPTEITDAKGVSMVLVPAGEFIMGNDEGNNDEKPELSLFLDAFYIDKFEVTNKLYAECVDENICQTPNFIGLQGPTYIRELGSTWPIDFSITNYYSSNEYENYPVVYVSWSMAKKYCEWRVGRLLNEAEWEMASRGPNAGKYPWGNKFVCNNLNYFDFSRVFISQNFRSYTGPNCDNFIGTAPVGIFSNGVSPYGVYDLAGNVSEWVSSLYKPYPYDIKIAENPNGEGLRVYRGSSYYSDSSEVTMRKAEKEDFSSTDLGFRCAKNATP